jgi:integrase
LLLQNPLITNNPENSREIGSPPAIPLGWEDYSGDELHVRRSICEGHVTTPKTDASVDAVPVIRPLAIRLDMHRIRSGNPASGPIFATGKGTHQSLGNIRCCEVLPVLNRCEVCRKAEAEHAYADRTYRRDAALPGWHGWHAFRRGLATNLHELGVPDKVIQRILRHKSVSVTQACYSQARDPAIAAAMQKLEEQLTSLDTFRTPAMLSAGEQESVN